MLTNNYEKNKIMRKYQQLKPLHSPLGTETDTGAIKRAEAIQGAIYPTTCASHEPIKKAELGRRKC